MGCFRFPELVFKEHASPLMHLDQLAALPGFLRFCRRAVFRFGQRNPQLLCDQANGLRKSNVLQLLAKTENIAGSSAAKTVVELPRRMDGNRSGLLLINR